MDQKMPYMTIASWAEISNPPAQQQLEKEILPQFLPSRRWFGGKGKTIQTVRIQSQIEIPADRLPSLLWLVQVDYYDNTSEKYLLPVCFIDTQFEEQMRPPSLCTVRIGLAEGLLCDAESCSDFRMALFRLFAMQGRMISNEQQLVFTTATTFTRLSHDIQHSRVLNAEQSNTSIIYGNSLFLKLYRKVEPGTNPDIELSKFLSSETSFPNMPAWVGSIQWDTKIGPIGVGILQEFLPDCLTGWNYMLPFAKVVVEEDSIDAMREKLESLAILTAEMHGALSSRNEMESFRPEPFDRGAQSYYAAQLLSQVHESFELLKNNLDRLPPETKTASRHLLEMQQELEHMLTEVDLTGLTTTRARVHGDFHLGQILVSNDKFMVTDFEGEPGRNLDERQAKQPVVKDVAGMIRSFQYLIYSVAQQKDPQRLEHLFREMSDLYVSTYTRSIAHEHLVPQTDSDLKTLLRLFILEKALYELSYELNNRPDWTIIPVTGLITTINDWMESGVQHA
jgi:maltose alpha-D-glucosyltransferase/alpha-amylase